MISACLEWLGSHWGRQTYAIVCEHCDWEDPTDNYETAFCPRCGNEVLAAFPNGVILALRWQMWKHDFPLLPQRMYVWGDGESYSYVQWMRRQWRKRPWEGLRVE